MINQRTPADFRVTPVGAWSNFEILPCGETIHFFAKGIGIYRWYSGFSCQETYFEWQPVGDFQIHVRWMDDLFKDDEDQLSEPDPSTEDIAVDGWELVSYSVVDGVTPYDYHNLQLRIMFGPVLAFSALWYQGELPDRPESDWTPPASIAQRNSLYSPSLPLSGEIIGVAIGVILGLLAMLVVLLNALKQPG